MESNIKVKYYPKCFNINCTWNMGNKYKIGYEYLNNSCYHNSDTTSFINCKEKKEKKEKI